MVLRKTTKFFKALFVTLKDISHSRGIVKDILLAGADEKSFA